MTARTLPPFCSSSLRRAACPRRGLSARQPAARRQPHPRASTAHLQQNIPTTPLAPTTAYSGAAEPMMTTVSSAARELAGRHPHARAPRGCCCPRQHRRRAAGGCRPDARSRASRLPRTHRRRRSPNPPRPAAPQRSFVGNRRIYSLVCACTMRVGKEGEAERQGARRRMVAAAAAKHEPPASAPPPCEPPLHCTEEPPVALLVRCGCSVSADFNPRLASSPQPPPPRHC